MQQSLLKVKKLRPEAKLPTKGSEGAAAFDVYANESRELWGGRFDRISTGIALEIPAGHYVEVHSRSGLAYDFGVIAFPGVIDSDYRGELFILLSSLIDEDDDDNYLVQRGDRIAQIVLKKLVPTRIEEVAELSETKRGTNGFGFTGR